MSPFLSEPSDEDEWMDQLVSDDPGREWQIRAATHSLDFAAELRAFAAYAVELWGGTDRWPEL